MATTTATTPKKTILFLGATGGCGLAVLRRSLAAGHTCIALCRTPSKLTSKLAGTDDGSSTAPAPANLSITQGDACDVEAVRQALEQHRTSDNSSTPAVDIVVFAIGGAFDFKRMTNTDPDVCRRAMETLLSALAATFPSSSSTSSSASTSTSTPSPSPSWPRIIAISTTGISSLGRDVPVAFLPMYHVMLKAPHKDKRAMEALLIDSSPAAAAAGGWTLVRPSLLVDVEVEEQGDAKEEQQHTQKKRKVRVGIEDPVAKKRVEKGGVGYTISREAVGGWMFENLMEGDGDDERWRNKAVTITW